MVLVSINSLRIKSILKITCYITNSYQTFVHPTWPIARSSTLLFLQDKLYFRGKRSRIIAVLSRHIRLWCRRWTGLAYFSITGFPSVCVWTIQVKTKDVFRIINSAYISCFLNNISQQYDILLRNYFCHAMKPITCMFSFPLFISLLISFL